MCAVSYDDVRKVAETIPTRPKVIALDPTTLGETMGDVRTIAQATGVRDAALDLVARQRARVDRVRRRRPRAPSPCRSRRSSGSTRSSSPGTGRRSSSSSPAACDVLGLPGEHSEQSDLGARRGRRARGRRLHALRLRRRPRARARRWTFSDELRAVGARRVVAVDAAAYFSRPGPRLVDGARAARPRAAPRPRARARGRAGARRRRSRRALSRRGRSCTCTPSAGRYGADRQLHALATGLDPERYRPARRAARGRRR